MQAHRTGARGADTTPRHRPAPNTVDRAAPAPIQPDGSILYDIRGRRRAKGTLPGCGAGISPKTKGRKFDPKAPSVEQIVAFLRAMPDNDEGRRLQALTFFGWRSGLRVSELVALEESDLNPSDFAITVRRGKGGKRRVSAMDEWGWRRVQPYLEWRRQYPIGPLFCILNGPTAWWRPMNPTQVRKEFRRYAERAGIRQRLHPHALRHAHAVELWREGVDIYTISRQLGHANVAVTAAYLQSLAPFELLEPIGRRRPPVMTLHDFSLAG